MPTQHFFADGAYLGSRQFPAFRNIPGEAPSLQPHYAFFCPTCGELWGRVCFDHSTDTRVISRRCLKHGDGRLSDWHQHLGSPRNFDESWPPAAIRHEFFAELTYRENLIRS